MMDPIFFKTNSILYGSTYRAEEVHEEIDRFVILFNFWRTNNTLNVMLCNRFLKFYQWIKSRNLAMSLEIKPMLMPILVFYVRESYLNGFKSLSTKLISDFSRKVLQEDATQENCLIAIAMSMVKNSRSFEVRLLF